MRLSAACTREASRLLIEYSLANDSSEDVLAFTRLYRLSRDGSIMADPSLAYCYQADDLLVVERAVIAPVDVHVDSPEIPLAEKIGAGGSVGGAIEIKFPARTFRPYRHDSTVIALDTPQRIMLRVGYLAITEESAMYTRLGSLAGTYAVDSGFASLMQQFAECELQV